MRATVLILSTIVAGLLAGCTPLASMTGARTLGARRMMLYGSVGGFDLPGMRYYPGGDGAEHVVQERHWVGVNLEGGLRYGVTDGLDLGLRVFPFGLALESGVQLLRSSALDLAVAPAVVGQLVTPGDHGGAVQLPLLAGINVGRSTQVVLGAIVRGELERANRSGAEREALFGGGSLAVAWWRGDGLFVQPELVAVFPLTDFSGRSFSGFGHDIMNSPRIHFGTAVGMCW